MCIYHIIFIQSSVDGHLGCFHVLATVNSAAMNIGVHASFLIMVFSGYMPRVGLLGYNDGSSFSVLRNLHTVLHKGCSDLHSHQQDMSVPLLSTPSSAFIIFRLFDQSYSDQCEVIPHCSFDLHFSNN